VVTVLDLSPLKRISSPPVLDLGDSLFFFSFHLPPLTLHFSYPLRVCLRIPFGGHTLVSFFRARLPSCPLRGCSFHGPWRICDGSIVSWPSRGFLEDRLRLRCRYSPNSFSWISFFLLRLFFQLPADAYGPFFLIVIFGESPPFLFTLDLLSGTRLENLGLESRLRIHFFRLSSYLYPSSVVLLPFSKRFPFFAGLLSYPLSVACLLRCLSNVRQRLPLLDFFSFPEVLRCKGLLFLVSSLSVLPVSRKTSKGRRPPFFPCRFRFPPFYRPLLASSLPSAASPHPRISGLSFRICLYIELHLETFPFRAIRPSPLISLFSFLFCRVTVSVNFSAPFANG